MQLQHIKSGKIVGAIIRSWHNRPPSKTKPTVEIDGQRTEGDGFRVWRILSATPGEREICRCAGFAE